MFDFIKLTDEREEKISLIEKDFLYRLNSLEGEKICPNHIKINNTNLSSRASKGDILVAGTDDVLVTIAKCCKPVKGDKIVGYITKGNGISVHRMSCHNLSSMDERTVEVLWNDNTNKRYLTSVLIHTNTSDNHMLDLMQAISMVNVSVDSMNTVSKVDKVTYEVNGIKLGIWICEQRRNYKEKTNSLFTQERIGQGGTTFRLYKFRSMVLNADEILMEILKDEDSDLAREYRINKKFREDPRITKVGKFIRRTSIDELPQLVNILKGEMSLIGNRPYLPREKEDMKPYYYDIVKTKPGLTGYWQVSGRSNTTFKHRCKLEAEYSNNMGFRLDMKIFFKTFIVLFKGM